MRKHLFFCYGFLEGFDPFLLVEPVYLGKSILYIEYNYDCMRQYQH